MSASCRLLDVAAPVTAGLIAQSCIGAALQAGTWFLVRASNYLQPGPLLGCMDPIAVTSSCGVTHCHIRDLVAPQRARHPHPPGCGWSPAAALTIGSAGIILRSSTACSVTRYLPRTAGFMHCVASMLGARLRRIRWWGCPVNEDTGRTAGSCCRADSHGAGRRGRLSRGNSRGPRSGQCAQPGQARTDRLLS
jgi:hypothetical protein